MPSRCVRQAARRPWRGAAAARPRSGAGSPARPARLPSATARLRCQRAKPMRRIALPSVRCRKSASLQAHSSSSVALANGARTSKSGRALRCANLFHGQTAGSRRNRRCGCRARGGIRPGSARRARSSGGRCSVARRPVRRDDGASAERRGRPGTRRSARSFRRAAGRDRCRSRRGRTSTRRRGATPACLPRQAMPPRAPSSTEQRRRVGEHAMAERADLGSDAFGEALQARPQRPW